MDPFLSRILDFLRPSPGGFLLFLFLCLVLCEYMERFKFQETPKEDSVYSSMSTEELYHEVDEAPDTESLDRILKEIDARGEREAVESHHRMEQEDADAYIASHIDLEKLKHELDSKSVFMYKDGYVLDALARLVTELKDKLSHYDTIVSDDASARLVSLIMRDIVKEKREVRGEKSPQIYFIAGERDEPEKSAEKIDAFIADHRDQLKKTLLVTEYIATGEHIKTLIDALERYSIDFDMGAVSISKPIYKYAPQIQNHLHYGMAGTAGLGLYDRQESAGVVKAFSLEDEQGPHPIPARDNERDISESVATARKDATHIAKELGKLVIE